MRTVFMYSGQGSQYFQMGKELFDTNPNFRQSMLSLDVVVRELTRQSVVDVLYSSANTKGSRFDRTLLTHPAIFMVEYSLSQTLMRAGVMPDVVVGASLGSFAAATVAGFIDVDEALTAVIRQASTLEGCCEPGGMLAVLASPELYKQEFLASRAELAAVNFASHFVVSTKQLRLIEIEAWLKAQDVSFQSLPVSFAFHSQWIDSAKGPFESVLMSLRQQVGQLPFVCCTETAVLKELPQNYFWNAIRQPIRFQEAIGLLERDGAYQYIDVGPAGTLATFLKYGLPSASASKVHAILTPYGRDVRQFTALTAGLS